MIHSSNPNTNGTTLTLHSNCTLQECPTSMNEHWISNSIAKTGTPENGNPPLKEHDGDKIDIN